MSPAVLGNSRPDPPRLVSPVAMCVVTTIPLFFETPRLEDAIGNGEKTVESYNRGHVLGPGPRAGGNDRLGARPAPSRPPAAGASGLVDRGRRRRMPSGSGQPHRPRPPRSHPHL